MMHQVSIYHTAIFVRIKGPYRFVHGVLLDELEAIERPS
jgi:hypothetical protein